MYNIKRKEIKEKKNEESIIDSSRNEHFVPSKLSIVTHNDEKMIYESDGPMSPIRHLDDSIHRIFCDGYCDKKTNNAFFSKNVSKSPGYYNPGK